MKRVYLSLLLGILAITAQAQFTSTAVTNGCTPSTPNPAPDNVNNQATLNRIGHAEAGTYGTLGGQWSAIGIPNLTGATPNSCDIYGFTANWDSDRFFCGLKDNGVSDKKDALIGWGDNDGSNSSQGPDRLIFSFYNTTLHDQNANGKEVATMYPSGNVGIGETFQVATPPMRRLDAMDNTNPQLRLTQTQNATITLGNYTDFQTTSLGDLYINPRGGNVNRRVGINTSVPVGTLHVAGDGIFRGTSKQYYLHNTTGGGPYGGSTVFVDMSADPSHGGIFVKGSNTAYPSIALGFIATGGNTFAGAYLAGQPTNLNPNNAEMNLKFFVKSGTLANQAAQERMVIQGSDGFAGFNVTGPTQQLDANGTARLRNIPTATPNVLLTGVGTGADYVVNRLAFPGTSNQVLLGDGTWGTPTTSVITADNGLTNNSGTIQLGQFVGSSGDPGKLLSNREIPMDDKCIYFTDNTSTGPYSEGRIGIGTNNPGGKVHILKGNVGGGVQSALRVENNDANIGSGAIGVDVSVIANAPAGANVGLAVKSYNNHSSAQSGVGITSEARLTGSTTPSNSTIGGSFFGSYAITNYGVQGTADGYGNSAATSLNRSIGGMFTGRGNTINTGVEGYATGAASGNTCYGGMFTANGTATNYYGILAIAPTSISTSYAGYFTGNVMVNGTTSGVGYLVASDQKFKKNIVSVKNGLEIIRNITATKYTYDKESFKMMNFPETSQYGFIAQNLEKYAPELVAEQTMAAQYDREGNKSSDEINFKAVNYIQMIPLLTSAVQELDEKLQKNEQLEKRIIELESLLNEICSNGCDNFRTPATSSAKPASVLFQNIPNPFTKSTIINYSIVEGAHEAEMLLSDMNGQPLQKINLEISKQGTISITADNLSAGIITYSLIVDGILIDTKKMIIGDN